MTDPDPVDGLRPGIRAVVRHRIAQGLTDALGDIVAIDADTVSVRTRRGVVLVDRADVVAAKEVPPRPTRRGAPHLAVSVHDLERLMVHGWPPLERAEVGGWLLRAAAGFTGRANSVLPLGDPGVPLSEAVDRCESWYAERGLRSLFSLFGPPGFAVEDDLLGRELIGRGYRPFNNTMVLTAATAALPGTPHGSGTRVRLDPTLPTLWWDACAEKGRVAGASASSGAGFGTSHPAAPSATSVAQAVMVGSTDQLFASVELDGAVIGVARVAFAQAWAGVSSLHVAPDHRRRGLALQLMAALADATRARGIRSMYLQVPHAHSAARGLYERLGFGVHHEYVYLGA